MTRARSPAVHSAGQPRARRAAGPAAAIAAYLRAKDENRPALTDHAFDPGATLTVVTRSDAIAFPPVTHGRAAITQVLVRDFARTYENIRTLCLASPPRPGASSFACRWVVGMSAKDGGAVRVGWGRYDWTFGATEPRLATQLAITIDVMRVLAAENVSAVTGWLFALPAPWCPIRSALDTTPPLEALEPFRAWAGVDTY